MASFKIHWWKATEIPLAEKDWRNIKKYCTELADPWDWEDSIYFFRLSPPFSIAYGDDEKKESIYIGSGAIRQRWPSHLKDWLNPLALSLPGVRYEIWVFRNPDYKRIEADALQLFRHYYGRIPLVNRNGGTSPLTYQYPDEHDIHAVADQDRRYHWAIKPIEPIIQEYFEKGRSLTDG